AAQPKESCSIGAPLADDRARQSVFGMQTRSSERRVHRRHPVQGRANQRGQAVAEAITRLMLRLLCNAPRELSRWVKGSAAGSINVAGIWSSANALQILPAKEGRVGADPPLTSSSITLWGG